MDLRLRFRLRCLPFLLAFCLLPLAQAQQPTVPSAALTIYNEDFAVVRAPVRLDLHSGVNAVSTTQVTSQLEPDSVVLRDASGRHTFRILEQNYDAGIVNQESMLRRYEGRTIQFQLPPSGPDQAPRIVQGTILRAGSDGAQPLIEVNGQMEFQLPGTPLFPASTDGLLLEPTLRWQIDSAQAQQLTAELAYLTGGLSWSASYILVAPQAGAMPDEQASFTGWVTIHNQSGTDFPGAQIKLMAGDVAKIVPSVGIGGGRGVMMGMLKQEAAPEVTQKPFDDFHLYDLHRAVTLLSGETKQVQFLAAPAITLTRSYRYDGSPMRFQPAYTWNGVNTSPGFGSDGGNTKVEIVEQFRNTQANHLGMPLPAGRIRVYRRDSDGQMEFVGESLIDHTPAEETVSIVTGSAFDIKAARRQTDLSVDNNARQMDESFEIRLTSQKSAPVTVEVIEHLNRGDNWQITAKSAEYTKIDSHTVQFAVPVPAKGTATVTYSVHYTW